jgi:uncharacterized glyoxalase superfamily protein PhnB
MVFQQDSNMPVIPGLTFGGTCRDAMTFYADVFSIKWMISSDEAHVTA